MSSFLRGRGRSMTLLAALAALSMVAGCSNRDGSADPGDNVGISVPPAELMIPDLPASLAPSGTGAARAEDICQGLTSFGQLFTCVTRHVFTHFAVGTVAEVHGGIVALSDAVSLLEIPPDTPVEATEDGITARLWWTEGSEGVDYFVDFTTAATGDAVGHWEWTLETDGGVHGALTALGALMEDGSGTSPEGLSLAFAANADGSERTLTLDVDMPGTPPVDDPSAPVAFRMDAVKAAGLWTLRYGMYNPTWLVEEVGSGGVPTLLLVNAVGAASPNAPGIMQVVAVDPDLTSVPVDVLTANGVCDWVLTAYADAGLIDPLTYTCPPANPFYIQSDGTVQEGGTAPAGFEDLVTAIGSVDFVTTDPTTIRDLTVGL